MNTLIGYDLVPEAKILDSALRACRRLDDLASAIRILEAVRVSSCTYSWSVGGRTEEPVADGNVLQGLLEA